MSTPANANFTVKTNGYWTQTWQINNNGVPVNLTGYTFELQVRGAKAATAKLYTTLTIGAGITVDAVNGKLTIEIAPMPTINITIKAYYDLVATFNGKTYVWLQGSMTLDPGATYV